MSVGLRENFRFFDVSRSKKNPAVLFVLFNGCLLFFIQNKKKKNKFTAVTYMCDNGLGNLVT